MILHIVEGPAGAGKSTLIQRLRDERPDVRFIDRRPDKKIRDYTDQQPLAFRKNFDTFIGALSTPGVEEFLFDRFILSQIVYERIRAYTGEEAIHLKRLPMALSAWMRMLSWMRIVHQIHNDRTEEHTLDLRFTILIPTIERLYQNRSGSGKEYPYAALHEHETYTDVGRYLVGLNAANYSMPRSFKMSFRIIEDGSEWSW